MSSDASRRRCRKRFLKFYPDGFSDQDYVALERTPKWDAHKQWQQSLSAEKFRALLDAGAYNEIASTAVKIESRTFLLFSFEKMALRDAIKTPEGARQFSEGLYQWLYGPGSERLRFEQWIQVVNELPRVKTRVATWPVVTIFGFIARPRVHMFMKPNVTKHAAAAFDYDFDYQSKPDWSTYANLLDFAKVVRTDVSDLAPRDMIDAQGYIWVQGSAEYD